jgi:hypothetical protein
VVSLALPILAHYFSAPDSKQTKTARPILPKGDGLDG